MKGLLAVARREVIEKRFVFVAAAAAALVPFAAPIARLKGVQAREAQDLLALILAATFAAVLAVALGFSILSKDQADRRIGFFFSRPLSSFGIWSGKLAGAFFIAFVSAAIVSAPALLAARGKVALPDLPGGAFWLFAAGIVALLLVSHALGVIVRSGSAWIVFDFAAFLFSTLVFLVSSRRLAAVFGMEVIFRGRLILLVLAIAGLLLGGFLSVSRGRADIRAAHRALSLSLWTILGTGAVALAVYTAWVLAASPRSLREVSYAWPAPAGNWAIVQGPARGFSPAFLIETSSGRYERVGADWRLPVLSADGGHAAWFEFGDGSADVVTLDLKDPSSKPIRSRITVTSIPALALLSAGGRRLATVSNGLLSVFDLSTGTSPGSARIAEARGQFNGFFLDDDRLRLFSTSTFDRLPGGMHLQILEFDVSTRKLSKTGSVDELDWGAWSVDAGGDRLLARSAKEGITLRDGRSGALLAPLRPDARPASRGGRFLSDGRIALGIADDRGARVEIFSSEGKPQKSLSIPAAGRIILGGEAAPGVLIVAAGGDSSERASRTIYVADLSSGEVRRVGDRLFPTVFMAGFFSRQPNYMPAPGSEATKLFYGPGRSLVRLDPTTGDRRVILP